MKKFISKVGSWTTYWIGDKMAKVAYSKLGRNSEFFYNAYRICMEWSINIQDWGGKGPWEKVEKPKKL